MAPVDNRRPLTILHTNDFHNRLSASGAGAIQRYMEQTAEPKILIDAGDAGGSSNITFRASGEPILDEMSRLGYSAMTVGNRDFHVSRPGFRAKLSRAQFPVLCANVRPSRATSGGELDDFERPLARSGSAGEPDLRGYVVLDVCGWRVLVFGLTVPMVTPRMWERKLSAYVFDPPIRTAAHLTPLLRKRFQPHLTVALTHIGIRLDRELASEVPGIDLIVGGHSHELLPTGELLEQTLIVQAGSHGHHIGLVVVNPPECNETRPKINARIEPI